MKGDNYYCQLRSSGPSFILFAGLFDIDELQLNKVTSDVLFSYHGHENLS